jgi:hypothetical protein
VREEREDGKFVLEESAVILDLEEFLAVDFENCCLGMGKVRVR